MKKTLLVSSTLGVLACLTHSALAQTTAPAAATTTNPAAPAATATTTSAATPTAAVTTSAAAPSEAAPTAVAADPTDPGTPPPVPDEPAPEAPPVDAPVATTTSIAVPPPPPPTVPKLPYMKRYLPEANMWELGLLGGLMFPSSEHQLFDPDLGTGAQRPFNTAGEIGVRVAYFPFAFVGVEAEAAAMPTSVDVQGDDVGTAGGLWAVRGQLVGQYPGWSVTPFVVLGFGALGASSDAMGNDVDDAWHFGAGVKVPLDEHLTARLDIRDTLHRQVNTSSGTGTHSPEILIGLTFVPKRRKPDYDKDGFVDYADECPAVAGVGDDCPPPDADADTIIDEKDECPADAGVGPTGCPDEDGDGFLDRTDPCPTLAGPPPTGCPEKQCAVQDTDGDGITDAADQCPAEAAATVTGCAPKDADGDGISDELDQCPAEPESKDGVADEDGCPEPAEPAPPADKAAGKGTVPAKPTATATVAAKPASTTPAPAPVKPAGPATIPKP